MSAESALQTEPLKVFEPLSMSHMTHGVLLKIVPR